MKLARGVAVVAAVVAVVSASRRAEAMGAVVGQEGEQVSLASVRLAVAVSPSRTTRWAQVTVQGANAGFVWLVPVRPGARVDLASDAWLDALDAATAPVILPPTASTECLVPLAPNSIAPSTSPVSGSPIETGLLFDVASVNTFVSGAGYAVPSELTATLDAAFASGVALAAFVYASAGLRAHTLRITDDGVASFPLGLSASSAGDVPVTSFVVGSTREAAGSWTLTVNPADVLWQADGQSTYLAVRSAEIEQGQGEGWLVEDTAQGLLFQDTPLPAVGGALPSVLGQYYTLASSYGDTANDPSVCTAAATATQSEASTYASACPAGALLVVPGMSPCVVNDPDAIAVDPLACGASAEDAAIAVAALSPQSIWVTRLDGIVTPGSASEVPLAAVAPVSIPAVMTAGDYASTCTPGSTLPTGNGSASGSGSSSDNGGSASDVASAAADSCDSGSDSGDDSSGCDADASDSSGCDSSGSGDSGGCSGSSDSSSCTTVRRTHGRGRSPVSRGVLLAACVVALLRRRRRFRGRRSPGAASPNHAAYGIESSSTSNTRVDPGGIVPPAPRSP
jgi:hypothetical protein